MTGGVWRELGERQRGAQAVKGVGGGRQNRGALTVVMATQTHATVPVNTAVPASSEAQAPGQKETGHRRRPECGDHPLRGCPGDGWALGTPLAEVASGLGALSG